MKNGNQFIHTSFFTKAYLMYLFLNPEGRISRKQYILGSLIAFLFGVLLTIAVMLVVFVFSEFGILGAFAAVSGVAFLFVLLVMFCIADIMLAIKRLHDVGWHGAFVLLLFVPMARFIFFIILCVCPGNENSNQYGASPLKANTTSYKQY